MIEHVGIAVEHFAAMKLFYEKALLPLGMKPLMGEDGHYFGFGTDKPVFWIAAPREGGKPTGGSHYAFGAKNKEEVKAFYDAALATGGQDNGAPGYRVEYSPEYYGAFVFDPQGNNVEAVFYDSSKKKS